MLIVGHNIWGCCFGNNQQGRINELLDELRQERRDRVRERQDLQQTIENLQEESRNLKMQLHAYIGTTIDKEEGTEASNDTIIPEPYFNPNATNNEQHEVIIANNGGEFEVYVNMAEVQQPQASNEIEQEAASGPEIAIQMDSAAAAAATTSSTGTNTDGDLETGQEADPGLQELIEAAVAEAIAKERQRAAASGSASSSSSSSAAAAAATPEEIESEAAANAAASSSKGQEFDELKEELRASREQNRELAQALADERARREEAEAKREQDKKDAAASQAAAVEEMKKAVLKMFEARSSGSNSGSSRRSRRSPRSAMLESLRANEPEQQSQQQAVPVSQEIPTGSNDVSVMTNTACYNISTPIGSPKASDMSSISGAVKVDFSDLEEFKS